MRSANVTIGSSSSSAAVPAPPPPVDALVHACGVNAQPSPQHIRRHGGHGTRRLGGGDAASAAERGPAEALPSPTEGSVRTSDSMPGTSTSREASSEANARGLGGGGGAEQGGTAGTRRASHSQPPTKQPPADDVTSSATHSGPASPKRRSRDRTGNGEDRHHSHENLHIRNVPLSMDERTLRAVFSQFGNITSAVIMRNIHTGESQGKAFVRFETEAEAARAMEKINGAQAGGGGGGGGGRGSRKGGVAARGQGSQAASAASLDFADEKGRRMSAQWARKLHDSAPVGVERMKMRKLFVRNIPTNVSPETLESLFRQFGAVSSVSIHHDTRAAMDTASRAQSSGAASPNGLPQPLPRGRTLTPTADDERRIAFITYAEEGVAAEAAQQVHNTVPFASCHGVPLMVKLAEDTPMRHGNKHPHALTADGNSGRPGSVMGGGTGPSSGFSSLNNTLSQLPSASSPLRMTPSTFPSPMGMVSLAGLTQGGGGGGGFAVSSLRSPVRGGDGSPVMAHAMQSSTSVAGEQGVFSGNFGQLGYAPSAGGGGGPSLPFGMRTSPGVPFAYNSLSGSPRFGTPAPPMGSGFVPTVALPSSASLADPRLSGAGSPAGMTPWGSAGGGMNYLPPQQHNNNNNTHHDGMSSSPLLTSLTGTIHSTGGGTPPVMATASVTTLRPWSAAASGAGSPLAPSLFSTGASLSGLPPSLSGAGTGVPYPIPAPSSSSSVAAAATRSAAPPQVFMPVPVYPSAGSALTDTAPEVRPAAGLYPGSAPSVPTLFPPSQGYRPSFTPPAVSMFVDPSATSPNPFLAHTHPDPQRQARQGSQGGGGGGGGPRMDIGQAAPNVFMTAPSPRTREASRQAQPQQCSPTSVLPPQHVLFSGQTSRGRDRAGSTNSGGSQDHRRSTPRKNSSAGSDKSLFGNSLTGGAQQSGAEAASAGLTGSRHHRAHEGTDDVLAMRNSNSVDTFLRDDLHAPEASTLPRLGTTSFGGTGSTEAWSSMENTQRSQMQRARPTMTLDAVMQPNSMFFAGDFNVFTPVAAGGTAGATVDGSAGASETADAERTCGDQLEQMTSRGKYTQAGVYQLHRDALTSAFHSARTGTGADGVTVSEASDEAGALEPQASLNSFMNEDALQQLMSQFNGGGDDSDFYQAPTPPTGF